MATTSKYPHGTKPKHNAPTMEVIMLRYECATCGNRCLRETRPDNTVCGGCDNPNWKLMKFQEHYIVGQDDYTHPDGEI